MWRSVLRDHLKMAGRLPRVYDESGNVIEAHEHKGEFKEW
jgi:hypothetical protein